MQFTLNGCLSAGIGLLAIAACASAVEQPPIEFNRDVRPILADRCFQCHGPDAKQRQADLRLDVESPEGRAAVSTSPTDSELIRRIEASDPDERMPPPDKGRMLTAAEVSILRRWVAQGAQWQKHWSLLPVTRPGIPASKSLPFARGPLDAFIQSRLEKEGLSPSPEADKSALLRRVTLALTGLPPAIHEIEAFLSDDSPDAYEQAVDRLLASPRYGERMATPWLDAARYADTSGYQSDGERYMWRWRDWVIESLNANMPFDQFTLEQLAGDLLPGATLDQQIATGFNRNHRGNAEGGIIPEEYAVEYVADRVETTATVWLGLTLGCCRCHDHKYDPFSQRDFYSLFAFFNNVPEKGRAIKIGNSPPFIQAPTRLQAEELQQLAERHTAALGRFFKELNASQKHMVTWQSKAGSKRHGDWYPNGQLAAHFAFDDDLEEKVSRQRAVGDGNSRFVAGRLRRAVQFDGQTSLALEKVGDFGFFDKFTLAAWIKLDAGGGGTIISKMADVPEGDGYQLAVVEGKLQFNLVKRWLDDALRVETADCIPVCEWHHVVATYDGSRVAEGVKLYVDGKSQKLNVLLDELNQSFASKEPLRIGGGGGPSGRFGGAIDEVRVYAAPLAYPEVEILATPQSIDEIVAGSIGPGTAEKLSQYYLRHYAPAELQASHREETAALRDLVAFGEKLPTVMVMQEMATPRPTHVLLRGQYDKPGERVGPNVPANLPPLAETLPRNRLGLAQWLVDPANPLTSRVTVNRLWQTHFGTGLVKTAEDFGRQGEWPSHPELLDWLAAELMDGWNVKRMHRLIVSSHTFRQSSANAEFRMQKAELAYLDPNNRLLGRGPRLRLPAEMVRDQALFASGLLVEQLGGPSVKPRQPAGLWSELTGGEDYKAGAGADLVRRSLYTFWKRTIPPPSLATFDAPTREFCSVRDSRTNTPLQALALLNEETFVAAASALAQRVTREAQGDEERIALAMLHALGRRPTDEESRILAAALARYRQTSAERAALALVCSTILNLDEAVTRQ